MNIIVLNNNVIDLANAQRYIACIDFQDDEFILKTPEGLFIHQRNQLSRSKPPIYALVTVPEIRKWLDGRAGVEFADLETAIDELGLNLPAQPVNPVSDDTPPDDGIDFGGDDNQEAEITTGCELIFETQFQG